MASVQGGRVVVADAAVRGQQEGVGYIHLGAVAVVVADHGVTLAVDVALGREFKQLVHFRVEDELADQPTAVGRVAGEILEFSGKQSVVIDLVTVVRPAELVCKLRRVVRFQHARQPILQLLPLFRGGLILFLRRHFLEVHLLVHPVHRIQQTVQRQLIQVIEAELALLGSVLMAFRAVKIQDLGDLRIDLDVRGLRAQACREQGQKKCESGGHTAGGNCWQMAGGKNHLRMGARCVRFARSDRIRYGFWIYCKATAGWKHSTAAV